MSKTSSKSKYTQLMEWLPTIGRNLQNVTQKPYEKFSRMSYYKSKGR